MPHTDTEVRRMLDVIGARSIDDLIAQAPQSLRQSASIALAPGASEQDVAREIGDLARRNGASPTFASFLGAGYYRHYVPAAVRAITSRAEFATSYTPYQAEASQGTTQAIFEFQTLITQLTGLDVANASMYDGASAAAEAVLMARRLMPKRNVVALSRALWSDYRETIRTYLAAQDEIEIVEIPFTSIGALDLEFLARIAGDRMLCAVVGYPNGFGVIEPLAQITSITRSSGALTISVTAEALALGLLKSPGECGADIAVGEGQSFGLPLQFGGPGVGFMAARGAHIRQMPGRLVGQTTDREGRRAFCLTLATREQHIRRERATSNICTNHSLCALAATVYLSLMGRRGLRELAERNVEIAYCAADALNRIGIARRFSGPFFNEFAVSVRNPEAALTLGESKGVFAGVATAHDWPELGGGLLISVTEMNQQGDIDRLCAVMAETR